MVGVRVDDRDRADGVGDGDADVTIAPARLVASATTYGPTVMVGAVVSCTLTVNELVDALPWPSVAVTVTVVVPIANVEPDAFEYVIVTGPTASVAVAAAYVTAAPAGWSPRASGSG